MDFQNFAYAVAQIFHNFGAVTVVAGSAVALVQTEPSLQQRLGKIVLAGWLIQIVSGASFGAISYYYYAAFPDLAGVARIALILKICCATFGTVLTTWQLSAKPGQSARAKTWSVTCGLAVLALCSAAILRWFS